jgi:hypothetical protein
MRPIVLGICVFVAACNGPRLDSPTSPSTAAFGTTPMEAQGGTDLPLRGSFSSITEFTTPTNARATFTGTASHVGQFVVNSEGIVEGNTGAGTFTLTAANGDQLSGTWEGVGEFVPPAEVRLTEEATIAGGTGRFAGASGRFTIVRVESLTSPTASSGNGTLEGRLDLNR